MVFVKLNQGFQRCSTSYSNNLARLLLTSFIKVAHDLTFITWGRIRKSYIRKL